MQGIINEHLVQPGPNSSGFIWQLKDADSLLSLESMPGEM